MLALPPRFLPSTSRPDFKRTPTSKRWSAQRKLDVLETDYSRLEEAYQEERSGRIRAETHCVLAENEVHIRQNQLNAKDKARTPRKTFRCKENFLTGPKADAAFAEQERHQKEKAAQEEERRAKQVAKQRDAEARRAELLALDTRGELKPTGAVN